MDVLYHLGNFPKLSESFILNETFALEQRGHQTAIYAKRNPSEKHTHSELEQLDIPIHYELLVSYGDLYKSISLVVRHPRVLAKLPPGSIKRQVIYLLLANQIHGFTQELNAQPDIIHSHFCTQERAPAYTVADALDVPFTVTAHAYDIFINPDGWVEWITDVADCVITVSDYNRTYLREDIGVETPIEVIPASIRPDKFEASENDVPGRVLTVARLVEKKGIEYAIDAIASVHSEHPELEYHIVGTGPLEQTLRHQVEGQGISDVVSFLGNVSDDRLRIEYDEAQVFVLPCVIASNGDRDAMPVVLKEAMAMKTPCVSTTVSAVPELIDHEENGLVVPPNDSASLAEAIDHLLSDQQLRKTFGKTARETVESDYDINKRIEDLIAIFEQIIAQS